MAETFTVDTNTPTETVPDSLTAEEQNSLAVGEEMAQQQETLLAGKYKNAEELEKAYKELEQKLGSQDEPEAEPEVEAEAETESETIEEELAKGYKEDGTVDYSKVTETYGSEISDVMQKAGVDPWSISQEFHDNQGQYTPEMVKQLTDAGFSEAAVKSYFAGRAAE